MGRMAPPVGRHVWRRSSGRRMSFSQSAARVEHNGGAGHLLLMNRTADTGGFACCSSDFDFMGGGDLAEDRREQVGMWQQPCFSTSTWYGKCRRSVWRRSMMRERETEVKRKLGFVMCIGFPQQPPGRRSRNFIPSSGARQGLGVGGGPARPLSLARLRLASSPSTEQSPSNTLQRGSISDKDSIRAMAVDSNRNLESIVTDAYLQSVLETCAHTREQCMTLIDRIDANPLREGQEQPRETQLELSKQQKLLYSYLSQLRGLNRNAILKVRNTKQQTAEARQEIDRLHLHLQNLFYEEMHLRGEISTCEVYEFVGHRMMQSITAYVHSVTNTNSCH